MKKLTGMKNFSSENKKLKRENLKSINGGLIYGGGKAIPSNLVNENGSHDTDYYDANGNWISRGWCCNG
ncbi:TIGR04139 family peptide modification target [Chryseobacterium populi]|nr:TIGR04139 family peptide modification target [Chryseobacterium populi]